MTYKPSTMLGLAIGDALGMPFEFSSSEMIIKSGWTGDLICREADFNGMWNLEPGQWTDDTKMAICIAESLLEKDGFDADHLASKYIAWIESKDLRGIGNKTQTSIYNMMKGVPPLEAGKKGAGRPKPSFKRLGKAPKPEDNELEGLQGIGDFCGCGTVMRCAPIGLFYYHQSDVPELIEAAEQDATMTHDHPDARDSSRFLCCMIGHLVNRMSPEYSCEILIDSDYEYDHVPQLAREAIKMAKDPNTSWASAIELGVRGTAHETLATALYCFLRYRTFREAVTAAVLMGGDTDSRASCCGALAGTYYGLDGIPQEFIEQIEDSERLQELDRKLFLPSKCEKNDLKIMSQDLSQLGSAGTISTHCKMCGHVEPDIVVECPSCGAKACGAKA
jgi:ADP-ribosyl-[dinitrogen reductase] hydrolase